VGGAPTGVTVRPPELGALINGSVRPPELGAPLIKLPFLRRFCPVQWDFDQRAVPAPAVQPWPAAMS
jgi:hypothetical protein